MPACLDVYQTDEIILQLKLLNLEENIEAVTEERSKQHLSINNVNDDSRGTGSGSTLCLVLSRIGHQTVYYTARDFLAKYHANSGYDYEVDGNVSNYFEGYTWNDCVQDILKFVQSKDRYMALTSTLLKSRAFHEMITIPIESSSSDDIKKNTCNRNRPIIGLPRTIHRKPYIPVPSQNEQGSLHPLSVSHQFPFVGMVSFKSNGMSNGNCQLAPQPRLLLGLDIVVFEEVNFNLYYSVDDFCDVFRENFTDSEWAAIVCGGSACPEDIDGSGSKSSRLKELYVRWAIKEAYTKALGVGMGYNFGSFETDLNNVSSGPTSLWKWISSIPPCDEFLVTTGSVRQIHNAKSNDDHNKQPGNGIQKRDFHENWLFFFKPLFISDSSIPVNSFMQGCCCVCIGPFADLGDAERIKLELDWTSLSAMLKWHGVSD